jgi:hypothetical protein
MVVGPPPPCLLLKEILLVQGKFFLLKFAFQQKKKIPSKISLKVKSDLKKKLTSRFL